MTLQRRKIFAKNEGMFTFVAFGDVEAELTMVA
jgi:hypothetical protein